MRPMQAYFSERDPPAVWCILISKPLSHRAMYRHLVSSLVTIVSLQIAVVFSQIPGGHLHSGFFVPDDGRKLEPTSYIFSLQPASLLYFLLPVIIHALLPSDGVESFEEFRVGEM